METLYCPGCDRDKPVSDFHRDSSRTRGFQTYCKVCHGAMAAEWWKRNGKQSYLKQKKSQLAWRKNNPEKYAARQRRYHLKKKYAMTEADFQARIVEQCGKCAICGEVGELVIDHCHARGIVRSLLCQPCNKGLGAFRDSPEYLRKASEYLERHAAEEK